MRAQSVTSEPPEARPALIPLCAYEKMSAILKADNNLCAILRAKCYWQGVERGVMMKVADVTGVAWQQMCVSSWQGLAASPVSGGGRAYSSVLGVSLCLSLFFSVSL